MTESTDRTGPDLVEFLTARYAEDVAAAARTTDEIYLGQVQLFTYYDTDDDPVSHAKRHTPSRVLREVDAKRRRLARYEAALTSWETAYAAEKAEYPDPSSSAITNNKVAWVVLEAWEAAVRLDALPYADHSDYKEAWRGQAQYL